MKKASLAVTIFSFLSSAYAAQEPSCLIKDLKSMNLRDENEFNPYLKKRYPHYFPAGVLDSEVFDRGYYKASLHLTYDTFLATLETNCKPYESLEALKAEERTFINIVQELLAIPESTIKRADCKRIGDFFDQQRARFVSPQNGTHSITRAKKKAQSSTSKKSR